MDFPKKVHRERTDDVSQPNSSRRGYPQKPRSNGKENPKYPCKECGKGVRSNQDALLCTECNVWSHAKCINLSKAGFKYYLDYPDIEWTCSLCSLPFRFEQSLVRVENLTQHGGEGEYANEDGAEYANDLPEPWIIQERKRNTTDHMMFHLNINSCQNKLDDLILLNKELKSHVIFCQRLRSTLLIPMHRWLLKDIIHIGWIEKRVVVA